MEEGFNPEDAEHVSLPTADLVRISDHVSLLPPLSRRGYGPGMILVLPKNSPRYTQGGVLCEDGIPPPLLKWAEESFAVVEIREEELDVDGSTTEKNVLDRAVEALHQCETCKDEGGIGIIFYGASVWNRFVAQEAIGSKIKAAVAYVSTEDDVVASPSSSLPCLFHYAGQGKREPPLPKEDTKIYTYPTSKSSSFAIPCLEDFNSANESISHTRNLTFLKRYIRGADFDIEAIWEEHTYFEFAVRSVEKTMATMVQEPYVNHITTMTGGIGRERLTNFYRHHFIFNNPKDTELMLVSRTVGIDRVCDEFIAKLTHDTEIDWLLPGIPPTGQKISIPVTSVVCVRGDRLYHEHIAWDQTSILIQLGLMPEYLPFPYPLADGARPGVGKRFEYRVPAAGVETAVKMVDKNGIASNGMFEFRVREVDA